MLDSKKNIINHAINVKIDAKTELKVNPKKEFIKPISGISLQKPQKAPHSKVTAN